MHSNNSNNNDLEEKSSKYIQIKKNYKYTYKD